MIEKLLNTLFEKLFILLINLYERMMFMGSVATKNGKKITVKNLAITFANGIMWDITTFDNTPKALKSDVALVLYINGCEKLITDETYIEEAKKRVADAENTVE